MKLIAKASAAASGCRRVAGSPAGALSGAHRAAFRYRRDHGRATVGARPAISGREPMSDRLEGKVAVITGGASGIGRATALTFLAEGARVVIGDMNEASIAETAALAQRGAMADRLASRRVDVSVERDVAGLVELAVERFDGLDCMFNNAGV